MLNVLDVAVVSIVVVLVLFATLQRVDFPSTATAVIVLGFLLRYVYAVVDNWLGVFAGRFDYWNYNADLWLIARQMRDGHMTFVLTHLDSHIYYGVYGPLFGPIYALFGQAPVLVRIVVALLGTLFVVNVYRIAESISDRQSATYAATFSAFFPYWIYLSGLLYRDMLIMLVLSELVYATLHWYRETTYMNRSLGVVLAMTLLSGALRPENFPAIGAMVGVAVLYKSDHWSRWSRSAGVLVTGIASLGAFRVFFNHPFTVIELHQLRVGLMRSSGVYLSGVVYKTFWELLAFVPTGTLYFLLVPFPWQVHNVLAMLALLQNLFLWYPVLVLSLFSLRMVPSDRMVEVGILLAYAVVGVVSYGVVEANMGPAMRHRSQFQFVFVVLAMTVVPTLLSKAPLSSRRSFRLVDADQESAPR